MAMPDKKPLIFTVIGGFLGAGKTTLVNRILAAGACEQGTRFAVLVNDFGALNIDQSLIVAEDSRIMRLANGCICCSLAGGLVDAMLALMQFRDELDHILIEASGVSNPSRIMDFARIDRELQPGLTVVLIDSAQFEAQQKDNRLVETLDAQLDSADIFLLTKSDIAPPGAADRIAAILRQRQPATPCVVMQPDDSDFTRFLMFDQTADITSPREHPEQINLHAFSSFAMTQSRSVDRDAFLTICRTYSADLLRGKGIIQFQDGPAVWQQTGRLIDISPTETSDNGGRLIAISAGSLDAVQTELGALGFSLAAEDAD